ncbi:uncharacterized protein H6S33_010460 [Morchella sextelata]|uniref:uncharacterized protein n=1 Tax=Morchella sextelata TaxID=1174677 RepID=UPI001D05063D|nr:uncharacterized protein H6S33_010460 [Morchella sextelata]KAH0612408.1 hypothetical protein H6S33_010460 [Morchella sextelata]
MPFAGLLRRGTSFFSAAATKVDTSDDAGKVTKDTLFPLVTCEHDKTDAAAEECDHDCAACPQVAPDGTSGYGKAFDKIGVDHDEELWGGVKKYSRHVIVATGETDWIRDVDEIPGSVMRALKERVRKGAVEDKDGKLMVSASNMPPPDHHHHHHHHHHHADTTKPQPTSVILLPSWTLIENVTPATTPELVSRFINPSPTNLDPLVPIPSSPAPPSPALSTLSPPLDEPTRPRSPLTLQIPTSTNPTFSAGSPTRAPGSPLMSPSTPIDTSTLQNLSLSDVPYSCDSTVTASHYPHDTLILLCSHKRRDARCGISAPILRKEFERHLRPLGLWRDMADMRPGGVKVLFINHVGGHKFSANVIVYRKGGVEMEGGVGEKGVDGEAGKGKGEVVQGVWLAKVTPRHVEGIVRYTVMEGKVCDSGLIRAGFDRRTGLSSW